MKTRKAVSAIIACLLLLLVVLPAASAEQAAPGVMRDITTMELVQEMGIGINLGNTFESFGDWIGLYGDGSVRSYETAWGSPMITREIIQGYADAGFGVLRIPVHWFNLMDEEYNISGAYMSAVREVVDWALDAGLYVIINIHHDENGFFAGFASGQEEEHLAAYRKIWSQIAETFRDYGDHLMFESLNEEGCWDSLWNRWGGNSGKAEAYRLLNRINQAFVDEVRASGGNNAQRHLLIAGYATGIDETCDALFLIPEDPANRCALSVHYYTPPTFAILEEDADWGRMRSTWGTDSDFAELNRYMDKIKTQLIDRGVPVIIGEYGCPKNNKDPDSVRLFLSSVCRAAYERGICPILWDVTGSHYDRVNCRMYDQELMDSLLSVQKTPSIP
mgnify:CR=1 FL=1